MAESRTLQERIAYMLMDMHDAGEVYISNGQMGDIVEYNVYCRCRKEGAEDDASIRRYIRDDTNVRES